MSSELLKDETTFTQRGVGVREVGHNAALLGDARRDSQEIGFLSDESTDGPRHIMQAPSANKGSVSNAAHKAGAVASSLLTDANDVFEESMDDDSMDAGDDIGQMIVNKTDRGLKTTRKGAAQLARKGIKAAQQGSKKTLPNARNASAPSAAKGKTAYKVVNKKTQRKAAKEGAEMAQSAARSAGRGLKRVATAIKYTPLAAGVGKYAADTTMKFAIPTGLALLKIVAGVLLIIILFSVPYVVTHQNGVWGTEGLGTTEIAIMNYLKDKGIDKVHAAAIMGNWKGEGHYRDGDMITNQGEIGVDPSSPNYGKGLASFTFAARYALDAEAAARGVDWTDLMCQLDVWYYMYSGDRSVLKINPMDFGLPAPNFMWRFSSAPTQKFADDYGYTMLSYSHKDEIFENQWKPISDLKEACLFYYFNFARGNDRYATESNLQKYIDAAQNYLDTFNSPVGDFVLSGSGVLNHPCPNAPVTSEFGPRSLDNHKGIDFGASEGTPYYAADDGTVLYATYNGDWNGGAGNWIVIDHGNGIQTRYMHSAVVYVAPGQKVTRGQHIGDVGQTGQAYGAHLHFEVIVNGTHVNPREYL